MIMRVNGILSAANTDLRKDHILQSLSLVLVNYFGYHMTPSSSQKINVTVFVNKLKFSFFGKRVCVKWNWRKTNYLNFNIMLKIHYKRHQRHGI